MGHSDTHGDTSLLSRSDDRVKEPPFFKVVLLNDDFTPMDFVVNLLMRFFNKTQEEATQVMLNVHQKGTGICGIYPREIAETKVMQVNRHARENGHPLRCRMEKN